MIIIIIYVAFIIIFGAVKKINLYQSFTKGVKENFTTILDLLPNLLFLFLGINIFLNSGIVEILENILNNSFVPELIIQAILRPLSNSSALIMMTKIFDKYGVDSLIGQISSVLQGSSDTTIYIIMIYFSSIRMIKVGHSLKIGLLVDFLTFVFVFTVYLILKSL